MSHRLASPAVTNQRHQAAASLDYFPTPPFAARALLEELIIPIVGPVSHLVADDPACGELHLVEGLMDSFAWVQYSDVEDWGRQPPLRDFTFQTRASLLERGAVVPDWIITNPPFNLLEEFILKALEIAKVGVAMFVRINALPGQGRYNRIYRDTPPTVVGVFAERIALIEGAWDPEASTATDYIWLVFIKGEAPRPTFFFPPGMAAKYTRLSDLRLAKPGEAARRAAARRAAAKAGA